MKATVEFEIKSFYEDGNYHCYIPAIDGYFSSKTEEDIEKKGSAMVEVFVNYWNQLNKTKSQSYTNEYDEIGKNIVNDYQQKFNNPFIKK